jgi:hypothetical protein
MHCSTASPRCQSVLGLLVVAVALLSAVPAEAQWRWRDANGRVTASDMPPPRDIPEKDILQRPSASPKPVNPPAAVAAAASAAASAAAPAASTPADKDLQAKKKAAEQEQQAKAKAEEQRNAAIRADNCARARSHLTTLESGQRLARVNEKGEREVLDDKSRADEVRRAREVIASDCR